MNEDIESWLDCGVIFSIGDGRVLMGWGERQWRKEPCQGEHPSFYFPDYFLHHPTPWFQHEYHQEMTLHSLLAELSRFSVPSIGLKPWPPLSKDFFYQVFLELQQDIAKGKLAKAVPFIVETMPRTMQREQHVRSLVQALHYVQNHPTHLYGFWNKSEGILGVSPEILFAYDNRQSLKTMACAGTRSIEESGEDLLVDPKEKQEHNFVVQGIISALSPYGNISVGSMQLLKLSRLMHLVTPIHVELNRLVTFEEIVKALHPTPAVGAFPKKEGRIWLEKYQQKLHRGRFGAPAGYCKADGSAHCCVAIRNVQWDSNQMLVAAGCGVVAESQCEQEWNEIQLKLKAIKEMLAI